MRTIRQAWWFGGKVRAIALQIAGSLLSSVGGDRRIRQGIVWALLTIAWVIYAPIAVGQVPSVSTPVQTSITQSKSALNVQRLGNIEYAKVNFDGVALFEVAASAVDATDQMEQNLTVPTIGQRVSQVENNLGEVIARGFDPKELRISVERLNNQPVIFATDPMGLSRTQIVTVTDLDLRLAGMSESDLTQEWRDRIWVALMQGLQERQPDYLWAQTINALKIIVGVAIASILIAILQRFLKAKWHQLHPPSHGMPGPSSLMPMPSSDSMQDMAVNQPLQFLAIKLPHLTLARKRNVNIMLRRLLQWLQVSIWLAGIISILRLFPQTREHGIWLSGLPVRLLAILLVMGLANKLSQVLIDNLLQSWAEQESLKPVGAHRQACRVPTYSVALKGLTGIASIVIGTIWVLYELRVPIAPILTGAGIFGFALSFSAQSLIRDMINGCLILLEDQYAVGDVIAVGNELGFVEHMNLRITQLRDPDGELVTIPNGSISTVRNLSNGWSRVNFEIEVSYDTNIDHALQVIETVAEQMRSETLWKDRIIEPADILGVDKMAHDGILIRVWIKTRPLQQWNVSREFRRRLRRAFEEHHIPIGVPQQFLWVRNGSDLLTFEQAMRSHRSTQMNDGESSDHPVMPAS